MDRAVVALPRANGNAPRHYRALPHREVAAALEAIRRVKYIHPSATSDRPPPEADRRALPGGCLAPLRWLSEPTRLGRLGQETFAVVRDQVHASPQEMGEGPSHTIHECALQFHREHLHKSSSARSRA